MQNMTNEVMSVVHSIVDSIRMSAAAINDLKKKVKEKNTAYAMGLGSNGDYALSLEEVRAANNGKKEAKLKAFKENPKLLELSNEVKELRRQLKEEQNAISDYLISYEKASGMDTVDSGDGTLIKIQRKAHIQLSLF